MKSKLLLIMITFFSLLVQADEVPLINKGGIFFLKATVNDTTQLEFAIDSGASSVTIPEKFFKQLQANGSVRPSDILGKSEYVIASGETIEKLVFKIHTLKIGLTKIYDIEASVGKGDEVILLGQSALQKLEPWSIERKKGIFKFGPSKIKTYRKNIVLPSQNINRNEVLDFIRYFNILQNDKKLKKIMKLYAPKVDYLNHGIITRENLSFHKENYFTEWDKIQIFMLGLNEVKDVSAHPGQKVVNYCVGTHLCDEDKECKRERYNVTLKLEKIDRTIKIISEKVKYLDENYH